MQRQLFLRDLEAKEINQCKLPQAIWEWVHLLINRGGFNCLIDHLEVFKIEKGYLHTVSPYEQTVQSQKKELIDKFLNQLGYIESPHRIYNEHAVTFYKVIPNVKLLGAELRALGLK